MTKKDVKELEILVPDTSVLIEGLVSKKIAEGGLKPQRVIVHEAVVAELEHQANQNKAKGFLGLDELDELRELTGKHGFNLEFSGRKPGPVEIRHARLGEIDAMIRDLAYELGATLFTSDKVQARIAKAKGMNYLFFEIEPKPRKFKLESFFDSTTMSVHLRENILAKAKKGVPGNWKFVSVSKEPITRDEIQDISKEIIEETGIRRDAFVEIERPGSTIVQLGPYRIVITKPPFSDGWEITAVRPVKKLSLEDYGLSEKLKQRVSEQAEGILIAGAPGMGKCLPGDEIVYLADGSRSTIKEIVTRIKNNEIIHVFSINGKGRLVKNRVLRGSSRVAHGLLNITTRTGRTIRVTDKHPLLCINEDGKPEWTPADTLSGGMKIASVNKMDILQESGKNVDWIPKLDDTVIAVKLSQDITKFIPYELKFIDSRKTILEYLRKHGPCSYRKLRENLSISKSRIRHHLNRFYKQGILNRFGSEKKYTYQIANHWKPKKGELILLKVLKSLIEDKKTLYDYVDKIVKVDKWHTCEEIKPVNRFSPEIAELLGYLIAESLTKIGICTDTIIAKERFIELMKKVFDIDITKGRNQYEAYIDTYGTMNEFLHRVFGLLDIKSLKRSRNHEVPEIVFTSSNQECAAFLRAYFDTESNMSNNIDVISASKKLIEGVQILLLRFGIIGKISYRTITGYNYTRLRITGYRNLHRFLEHIGFLDSEKYKMIIKQLNYRGSPNRDLIPAGMLLKTLNTDYNLGHNYDLTKNEYSRERLLQVLEKPLCLESNELIEIYNTLKFMASEYILWEQIVAIERIDGAFEVFDIEVENAHNFLAGNIPIIVHNSTFAQALAEHYASQDKIVKTIEAPRDLILGDNITQYAISHGDAQEIHDILLLSRPDNTVFDEMRNTNDFKLFADLRLSGIGLAGVVHATNPIDAVQRFVGRIELGVIPHVIDTVIFIKNGKVDKVLSLKMTVKVPSGMTEDDLARPVVVVEDFETGKLVFELYSYGEETVVIPISETKSGSTPSRNLAAERIKDEFRKYSRDVSVEMVSDHKAIVRVPESDIAKIIGKQGKTINEIEKTLGIGIDVQEKGGKGFSREASDGIAFHSEITNKHILLTVDKEFIDRNVSIILDGDYLLTAHVSKEGTVRIKKKNKIGKILANAINSGEKVQVAVQ